MAIGLGVDVHPVYQAGAIFPPTIEYAWIKMADGAAVYAKTVNGVRYTADAHALQLRGAGIPYGGYEFAQLGTDGVHAFDVLWAECLRLGATGVAPAVDIEGPGWTTATATARGRAFCARARARGVRPAVYMDLSLLQACRADRWPENPVIWAPRYGAKPEAGGRYTGRYDVHQYSSSGTLLGTTAPVDLNQSYTTAHLLTAPAQEDDVTPEDIKAVAAGVWAAVIKNKSNGNPDPASESLGWTLRGIDVANAKLDAVSKTLGDLALKVAAQNGVTAADLAAALLPGLRTVVVEQLRDVAGLDENAVATKVADVLHDRLSA